ncbi:MAG: hypothetical protein AABY79_03110 [Nitrospirota bacterium]|jgi:hypothetical protein
MKKISVIVSLVIIFMLSGSSSSTAGQGMIGGTTVTVEPAMTRGHEKAPVTIYEFSSYQ